MAADYRIVWLSVTWRLRELRYDEVLRLILKTGLKHRMILPPRTGIVSDSRAREVSDDTIRLLILETSF
jgi:hypothetical protein